MVRAFCEKDVYLLNELVAEEKCLYNYWELNTIYKMMLIRVKWIEAFEAKVLLWHFEYLIYRERS